MLKRKVMGELLNWKNKDGHKCLVVQGARQVGKSYIVREFAKENYQNYIELNFKEKPSLMDIFRGDLDAQSIISALHFRFPKNTIDNNTLLFIDEIQECPEAITALKFLSIAKPCDVIASGSLLGIDYKRASSYPAGYVEYLKMYSLDFEEFLWALAIEETEIVNLKNYFDKGKQVPLAINNKMQTYFRLYMAIGGMPEVVDIYVKSKDFVAVDTKQKALLNDYLYDIAHYASGSEKLKAEQCFLSLEKQLLAKENHKFQYKYVLDKGNAQKLYSSVDWLIRADIAYLSNNVSVLKYDLNDYELNNNFRLYSNDISFIIAMRDFDLKRMIVENDLSGNTKGGLYECVISDMLLKKGYQLHFYRNESHDREIEFIIQKNGEVIPIEVKANKTKAKSLKFIMEQDKNIKKAYKLINGNVGIDRDDPRIITIPHYMTMFI